MRKSFLIGLCLVVSMLVLAQGLPKVGNQQADDFIVRMAQSGWRTQGASLSFDAQSMVLSILKSPKEDYDLYVSQYQNGKWQMPQLVVELSAAENEWSPTIASDGQSIYFIREDIINPGTRKERKVTNLYSSVLQPDGKWQTPQLMVISNGYDSNPLLLPDNVTLCFTSVRDNDKKAVEKRYFIRKVDKYNWTLPIEILPEQKEADLGFRVQTVSGIIKDANGGQGISAQIDVYDALTQQRLSSHKTDEKGAYRLALTTGRRYKIDAYKEGYSHEYFWSDLCGNYPETKSWTAKLSTQLTIRLTTYDSEVLSPLLPEVQIFDSKNEHPLNLATKRGGKGDIMMRLPIGEIYSIRLHREAYADTIFYVDTKKDVLMSVSELDMLMRIGKVNAMIEVRDAETNELINTELTLSNLSTESDDIVRNVRDGRDSTSLRCATRYRFQLNSAGYFYTDTIVEMPSFEQNTLIAMQQKPLRQETVVQLRNIHFEYASYLLTEDSYEELHQVAELMRQNPSLRIEISAHTDDRGSSDFNKKLSQKRGESAANYLIDAEGIDANRLEAVGYGKEKPLVPNTSDENRALNRRVEFVILDL